MRARLAGRKEPGHLMIWNGGPQHWVRPKNCRYLAKYGLPNPAQKMRLISMAHGGTQVHKRKPSAHQMQVRFFTVFFVIVGVVGLLGFLYLINAPR